MPIQSVAGLVDAIRQHSLLGSAELLELARDLHKRFTDPRELAKELLRRGWLTSYQINRLFQDRAGELVLGQYILLEPIGEGGMGTVFKARHQRLDRIDALKLIRKEFLVKPTAIERFHREARAAARLSHPNVITVYDAGQVGENHFLAMEYIEGTDLGKLVKKNGPLPIAQACDCTLQAALGLQHAFEQGLIHRDIKPSNLLLRKAQGSQSVGSIKVLDMGLARIQAGVDTAHSLTETGAVVGTPDYIAPEQARNAKGVDIRADLYSLGCTLYYLLTANLPFPGETLTEKLIKHQLDEPQPVEALRPDLPPALAALVRKLMAKRPEDRYQTPAEVAASLEPFVPAKSLSAQSVGSATAIAQPTRPLPTRPLLEGLAVAVAEPVSVQESSSEWVAGNTVSEAMSSTAKNRRAPRLEQPFRGRALFLMIGVGGALLLLLALAAVWAMRPSPRTTSLASGTTRPVTQPVTRPTPPTLARLDPKEASACFDRGLAHQQLGDLDTAIGAYTDAIRLDPRHANAYANRGFLYSRRKLFEQAIADFDRALQIDPKLAVVYHNRAAVYFELHEWDKAIADNNEFLKLNPTSPVAYSNRGTLYMRKGLTDAALADYNQAILLAPDYARAYFNRGNLYLNRNDPEKALADFDKLIQLEPKNADAYVTRGTIHLQTGNQAQALADLNQAIKINPNYAPAFWYRSHVYTKMGNQPLADADRAQALRLDPNVAKTR